MLIGLIGAGTSILDVEVGFKQSKYADNDAVKNISLLGADFIDQCCLMDDYQTKTLRCLPRILNKTRRTLPIDD